MTAEAAIPPIKDEILAVYGIKANKAYGLHNINQLQHALQAAALAEAKGLPSSMVIACLLHDVGHMVHSLGEAPAEVGVDDRHEELGANWVRRHFGQAVSEPIRLHVQAKRYLCSVDPVYEASLARDSVISLALQGGPLSLNEQEEFLRTPFAQEAISLRQIDKTAKDPMAITPTLEDILDRHLTAALAKG